MVYPEKWVNHIANWAGRRGYKHQTAQLKERRTVCGVGAGAQHADDSTRIPIGLEDKKGKHHLADYKAAVIRNSSLPALLGLDSLSDHNVVIQVELAKSGSLTSEGATSSLGVFMCTCRC